jgi:hypothetical protein
VLKVEKCFRKASPNQDFKMPSKGLHKLLQRPY